MMPIKKLFYKNNKIERMLLRILSERLTTELQLHQRRELQAGDVRRHCQTVLSDQPEAIRHAMRLCAAVPPRSLMLMTKMLF